MSKARIFLVVFVILFPCFGFGQIIKGVVRDSSNLKELIGVTIVIKDKKNQIIDGTVTDHDGKFEIAFPKLAEFCFEYSYVGYHNFVECVNKETVAPSYVIFLGNSNIVLDDLVIRGEPFAYFNTNKINVVSIDGKHPGLPASFSDPSRNLMRYPGVSPSNSQSNSFSYRGFPNEMVNWKVEGAEILAPNHLSNAGTVRDRSASNSGGVLAVPFEVLDEYKFYPSPYSKKHTNAIAGISDLYPKREVPDSLGGFGKVGILGLEAGLHQGLTDKISFQSQYRYSFTGLLADFGIDFDGEKIKFQDFNARVRIKSGKNSESFITTILGKSNNEKITDRENINFDSDLRILGFTNYTQLNEKANLHFSIFGSMKKDQRNGSNPRPDGLLNSDYFLDDQKKLGVFALLETELSENLNQYISSNFVFWDFVYEVSELDKFFCTNDIACDVSRNIAYADQNFNYGSLSYGLDYEKNTWRLNPEFALSFTPNSSVFLEPALTIQKTAGQLKYSLASSMTNQVQAAGIYAINENRIIGLNETPKGNGQTQLQNSRAINTNFQVKYDRKYSVRSYSVTFNGFYNYLYNLAANRRTNKYQPFYGLDILEAGELSNFASAHIYGLDVNFNKELQNDVFINANISTYNIKYKNAISENQVPNNFEQTLNLMISKRWTFGENKLFLSFAMHSRGGNYVPFPDQEGSIESYRLVYDYENFLQVPGYTRFDMRLHFTFKKKNQIILDVQNLTSERNPSSYGFSQMSQQIFLEEELGAIPVFSYKRTF